MADWLHHVLAAGRILFKNTFEAYMDQYMQFKIKTILQEHRLVSLITQLRGEQQLQRVSAPPPDAELSFVSADAVFCERGDERSVDDKQARAKQTFEEMMKYLPGESPPPVALLPWEPKPYPWKPDCLKHFRV